MQISVLACQLTPRFAHICISKIVRQRARVFVTLRQSTTARLLQRDCLADDTGPGEDAGAGAEPLNCDLWLEQAVPSVVAEEESVEPAGARQASGYAEQH